MPVVATGIGHLLLQPGDPPCDPTPWLKVKKGRKFMGVQDDLAVAAAATALASAGVEPPLGERVGLYLAVGYIPFDAADLDAILAGSLRDGVFSMERFASEGYGNANPLLTFRCLSNMPAYHVSYNFDLQGPYAVTYPGAGQAYAALEEAMEAVATGLVDKALWGGVAHQRNFLVEHHHARLEPPTAPESLRDAAGFLLLEQEARAHRRGARVAARLAHLEMGYAPRDPFEPSRHVERAEGPKAAPVLEPSLHLGAASLPVAIALAAAAGVERLSHTLEARDGMWAKSVWDVPA